MQELDNVPTKTLQNNHLSHYKAVNKYFFKGIFIRSSHPFGRKKDKYGNFISKETVCCVGRKV